MVAVALAHAASLAAGSGEAAHLAVLHGGVADPVDARIVADHAVGRIDQDHLEELVHAIGADPVRVEHAQIAAATADALLGKVAEGAAEGHVVDGTGRLGLAIDNALVNGPLAVATANTDTVDNVSLLGLVAQPEHNKINYKLAKVHKIHRGKESTETMIREETDAEISISLRVRIRKRRGQ